MTDAPDNLPPAAPTPSPAPQEPPAPSPAPANPNRAPSPSPDPSKPLASGGSDDKPVAAPADWPEAWRAKLSGEDKKELARLERFGSPADIWKAYRALEQKLSSGEVKSSLPKDATPEQLSQWRKDNGIPEAPEKYEINLEGGLVVGEQDKPRVDEFLKAMHGANASPAQVNAALNAYYKLVQTEETQLAEADSNFRSTAEDELRAEWGGDFRRNVNMVSSLLDSAPGEVGDLLRGGRTADGKLLGDHPAVMRWLVNMAREVNPVATVVPNAGANGAQAIGEEIASIEKAMRDRSSDYWKGPKAQGGKETVMQVRYRELVDSREKMKARA